MRTGADRSDEERFEVVEIERDGGDLLEQFGQEVLETQGGVFLGRAVDLLDDALPVGAELGATIVQQLADEVLGGVVDLLGLLTPQSADLRGAQQRQGVESEGRLAEPAESLEDQHPGAFAQSAPNPMQFRTATDEAGFETLAVSLAYEGPLQLGPDAAHRVAGGGLAEWVVGTAMVEDQLGPAERVG